MNYQLIISSRYVKWTLNAYPSAQATTESGLRELLERATKAFITSNDYKNDPRCEHYDPSLQLFD